MDSLHISERNKAIEQIINTHIYNQDMNTILHDFVRYKQKETSIWSKLPIYTHYMMGGNSPHLFHAAAQTELIILSLDIFDDLQDQDNFAPPWMECELSIAMNAASALLIAAIAGNLNTPLSPAILKLITTAHNGQHNDIRGTVSNEEEYLQLINEKSSALISLAIQMGYQLTDTPDSDTLSLFHEMAGYIGVAAQLENDIKDISQLDSRNDIVQRKTTLATLYLKEQSESAFPLLLAYYNGSCELQELLSHEHDFEQFTLTSGVIEYTNAVQHLYIQQANSLLERLITSMPWVDRFKEITINLFLKT